MNTEIMEITRKRIGDLLEKENERFVSLHPRSLDRWTGAREHLLGGVPMPWMTRWAGAFPLSFESASGGGFRDVDGIDYIDLCLGDTGAMTGHASAHVADAIYQQARRGITTMMPNADAAWVGEELSRRFGLPKWQIAMTATDANRFVLRFARHLTGKAKILIMDWCYHGTVDETLAVLDASGRVVARPGSLGPQVDPALTTRVVQFNDLAGLEQALAHDDVACVMMEPALTNIGIVLPEPGYLLAVRELATRYGALLAIDETHTVCVGPGGATMAWGLSPDFLIIGKTIGGGIAAAAYGMTDSIAERLSIDMRSHSIDTSGVGGTLTGNALALAAVRATLSTSLTEPDFAKTIPLATRWTQGVAEVIAEAGLAWHVQQLGCRAEYWFCPPPSSGAQAAAAGDAELETLMHLWAINRGILLAPFHNMALFSPQRTTDDVDAHTQVFHDAVAALVGV
jgi:glutamate-1-semialdehyde 2,1-aminomutase